MKLVVGFALLASFALLAAAQKPVYLCNGVYTDNPCKDGREVDIAPTRGVHSMSGTKRRSTEAMVEEAQDQMDKATVRSNAEVKAMLRCAELQRRRQEIDAAGQPAAWKDERFAIRQEQFKLNCKRT